MSVGMGWASVLADMLKQEVEVRYGNRRKTFDVWDEKSQRWRRVKKPWHRPMPPLFKEPR